MHINNHFETQEMIARLFFLTAMPMRPFMCMFQLLVAMSYTQQISDN
jgi:hypothetical protein